MDEDTDTGNMITVLTILIWRGGGGEDVVPDTRFVLVETMHYKMGSHDPFSELTYSFAFCPSYYREFAGAGPSLFYCITSSLPSSAQIIFDSLTNEKW